MRRGIISLICLGAALMGTAAHAQNTFPSSGNVGIGTTTPKAELDVVSPYTGNAPSLSSVPGFRINGGGALSTWFGNYGYTSTWIQSIQDDGSNNLKGLALNPLGGPVGIGTANPSAALEVNGTLKVDTTGTNGLTFSGAVGTQTTPWTGVLCGGDYAESVDVAGSKAQYEPGDLIVVDPHSPGHFLKSTEPYSTLVAGIYSTSPGVVGKRTTDPEKSGAEIPMAMVGIVPTKVSAENGPVEPGDLLVASSTPGYAMKGTDRERIAGAVVGKALGSVPTGTGIVDVLVTLQ